MRKGEFQDFPCLRDKCLQRGQDVFIVHFTTKFVPAVDAQVPGAENEP